MPVHQFTVLKKVQESADSYNEQLSAAGIRCSVSLKKFTVYGYDGFKRNIRISSNPKKHAHYRVIVIRISPLDSGVLPTPKQKEYAFKIYCKKNGIEKNYSEAYILHLTEKLFNKVLKRSKNRTPLKMCQQRCFDFFRYISADKYRYQTKVFGIKRGYIDLALTMLFAIGFFIILFLTAKDNTL